MTPTEQDKELREAIGDVILGYGHAKIKSFEAACNEAMQLITADRERVALEAELKVWMRLKAGDGLSTHDGCFEIHPDYINEQIAQLKAQQEEV